MKERRRNKGTGKERRLRGRREGRITEEEYSWDGVVIRSGLHRSLFPRRRLNDTLQGFKGPQPLWYFDVSRENFNSGLKHELCGFLHSRGLNLNTLLFLVTLSLRKSKKSKFSPLGSRKFTPRRRVVTSPFPEVLWFDVKMRRQLYTVLHIFLVFSKPVNLSDGFIIGTGVVK